MFQVTTRRFGAEFHHTRELGDPCRQEEFVRALAREPSKIPKRFVYLNQVHGSRVAVIDAARGRRFEARFTSFAETDSVITNASDLGLIVMTADCLSIFFEAGDWIGVAHAGWRGTKEGICSKTLEILSQKSGKSPSQVSAIFGPCIRSCHYEVGLEFTNYFPAASLAKRDGKLFFDLASENKRQLLEAGASERNIADSEACTVCKNQTYYSYRFEGDSAGRMISWTARL